VIHSAVCHVGRKTTSRSFVTFERLNEPDSGPTGNRDKVLALAQIWTNVRQKVVISRDLRVWEHLVTNSAFHQRSLLRSHKSTSFWK